MTYVEEKFGLRIRKPSEAGFRESSDPTDVGVVSTFLSGEGKWSSDPRDGCFFKGDAAHFQRDCSVSKNTSKQTSGKGNRNKSWSMSELSSSDKLKNKEKSRRTQRIIQRNQE